MDSTTNGDASSPPASVHSSVPESEFNEISISTRTSSGVNILRELENTGKTLTRFELDISSVCEKLINLNLLYMHVETMESDFETFVSDIDHNSSDLCVKALEFDYLSGFLASEVRELEAHISDLQIDKANIQEFLFSRKHFGEPLMAMEDRLRDSEKSLEQSLEQVLEIKVRSVNFERNLLRFGGEESMKDQDYAECSPEGDLPDLKEKIKMQTVEHQRHILRMLEKSLERELNFEKEVGKLTQIEEGLTMRLHASEQDVLHAEEEAEIALEKLYESDNTCELLMGISKDLSHKIQMLEFNLKGSVQRESELSSKLQESVETLKVKGSALLKLEKSDMESELELVTAKESIKDILEMESTVKDLKEKVFEAEIRAEDAEAKYQLLTETNNEVKDASEKVVLLEKELRDAKNKLQQAEACVEASQEKQDMLFLTIKDMESVIENLKKKVSKAESQTESVEDKCIFLSESNADLSKELSLVKGRVKSLEVSLHRTEETKKATAKDISLRTKFITDLVMQMALERERLQKQIFSLKHENKILVKRLKKTEKGPSVKVSHGDKTSRTDRGLSEIDFTNVIATLENTEALSTRVELDNSRGDTAMGPTNSICERPTARNIDVRELKLRYVFLVVIALMIPVFGVLLHQSQVR